MAKDDWIKKLQDEEELIKRYWEDVKKHIKRDLAYIWTDEVREDFAKIKIESSRIAFILRKLHFHYRVNPAMYQKEIADVKNLIHHLNKIEAKAEWVKQIHMDLDKIISDTEREIQIAKQNRTGFRKIYHGVWIEYLESGDELPIGGSIFSDELSTKLKLDFDTFEGSLQNYKSPKIITEAYIKNKAGVVNWLNKLPNRRVDLDPYIFFVCQQVGGKIRELLDFDPDNLNDSSQRQKVYAKGTPSLSSLKGITECGEQAALGQYLLQRVLEPPYTSAYMSCVTDELRYSSKSRK